jgi:hypothetical protein
MVDEEIDLIDRAFAEGTPIDAALIEAVRQARRRHKEAGNPVVEWRDGKLFWVAPEDIELDEDN